jgi:hypothetical protein
MSIVSPVSVFSEIDEVGDASQDPAGGGRIDIQLRADPLVAVIPAQAGIPLLAFCLCRSMRLAGLK